LYKAGQETSSNDLQKGDREGRTGSKEEKAALPENFKQPHFVQADAFAPLQKHWLRSRNYMHGSAKHKPARLADRKFTVACKAERIIRFCFFPF